MKVSFIDSNELNEYMKFDYNTIENGIYNLLKK